METRTSWCHRQLGILYSEYIPEYTPENTSVFTGILSSIISKANGAYIHLGVHAALQTRKRKQLEVTVEMLVQISWHVFPKVQFRDVNGAFAVVEIISVQEVSPCKLLCWDWDLPHCKGAGITVNHLLGSQRVRNVQPLTRNTP